MAPGYLPANLELVPELFLFLGTVLEELVLEVVLALDLEPVLAPEPEPVLAPELEPVLALELRQD
ncbi:hypothetical protein ACFLVF_02480 [Chloroflexota bacterium]